MITLKPCGTYAAYRRHHKDGEPPCEACSTANRDYRANLRCLDGVPSIATAAEVIEEIEWMLHLNQGSGYIIKAIGYTGRERALGVRLQRNGRSDLVRKVLAVETAAA